MVFGSARAEVLPGGPTADRLQAMWIGVALAATGGMVILLTKLVMLRPLRQLERHAMRLLGNDMVVEDGWPDGRGELGRLARVFQHVMRERAAIQKSGDELFLKMQAVMSNAAVGIAFTRLSQLVRSDGSRFWTRQQGALVRAGDISAGTVCRWVSTGASASSKSSPRGWTSRR